MICEVSPNVFRLQGSVTLVERIVDFGRDGDVS